MADLQAITDASGPLPAERRSGAGSGGPDVLVPARPRAAVR